MYKSQALLVSLILVALPAVGTAGNPVVDSQDKNASSQVADSGAVEAAKNGIKSVFQKAKEITGGKHSPVSLENMQTIADGGKTLIKSVDELLRICKDSQKTGPEAQKYYNEMDQAIKGAEAEFTEIRQESMDELGKLSSGSRMRALVEAEGRGWTKWITASQQALPFYHKLLDEHQARLAEMKEMEPMLLRIRRGTERIVMLSTTLKQAMEQFQDLTVPINGMLKQIDAFGDEFLNAVSQADSPPAAAGEPSVGRPAVVETPQAPVPQPQQQPAGYVPTASRQGNEGWAPAREAVIVVPAGSQGNSYVQRN